MSKWGWRATAVSLAWAWMFATGAMAAVPAAAPDTQAAAMTRDARAVAGWVLRQADHRGRPFAIVDKKDARVHVFEANGQWLASSPVLLGLTPGDRDAVPQLGERSPGSLAPHERITPSGRFDSAPGRNDKGEAIVWFQYDGALAIHRLRPAPAHERRPQRMASPDAAERRISFGCIVVPEAFYDQVVAPTLGSRAGVVYVLPEAGPVEALLRNADLALRAP